jgi:hypothetical protein
MVTRRAVIRWKTREEGGRAFPPSGEGPTPYRPVVHFADEPEEAPAYGSWSLVVQRVQSFGPLEWLADVHFLVEEAPQHLLRTGAEFSLYEGPHRVADGRVVEAAEPAAVGSSLGPAD